MDDIAWEKMKNNERKRREERDRKDAAMTPAEYCREYGHDEGEAIEEDIGTANYAIACECCGVVIKRWRGTASAAYGG